jgi:hypothetical protein
LGPRSSGDARSDQHNSIVQPTVVMLAILIAFSLGQEHVAAACTDYDSFFKELDTLNKELQKDDGQSWKKVQKFSLSRILSYVTMAFMLKRSA